ncbi:MAG: hypothetical protein IJN81_04335, partial [Clostridia bacterium]|nr:hypothetical protein [Clostridia bacterium]
MMGDMDNCFYLTRVFFCGIFLEKVLGVVQMISGKSKDKLIIVSEYVIVFLVISLAFFFMIPQSDVFLFARATHGELSEVINHALYYGNGRLLGNIIGMFFSNYFEYAFLTVSVGLTLMIALLNEFLFNQSKYMIIPLALIVMFPSSGMISEAYYVFPAFCNYVLPCVFFLISVICIKRITDIEKLTFPASCFFALTIVVSGVSVCLFSENTTIIALTFSVLQLLYTFATMKKVKFLQVVYTFSVFIGAAIMYLLPKITKTSHNMDHYRSVEISIHRILASFARFSEVMISLSLVLAILSVALILLCWKKTNFSPIIKYMLTSFYVLFTVVSFVFRDFETADIYISRINFIAIAVVGAYIMLTIIIIFSLDEKQIRFQMLLYGVLLASSIAPMMFVNQYGFRTYYLTAIIILMIACSVLKK